MGSLQSPRATVGQSRADSRLARGKIDLDELALTSSFAHALAADARALDPGVAILRGGEPGSGAAHTVRAHH